MKKVDEMTKYEKIRLAMDMKHNAGNSNLEISKYFGISERTVRRWIVKQINSDSSVPQKKKSKKKQPKKYPDKVFKRIYELKEENLNRSAPIVHSHIKREFPRNFPSVSTIRKFIAAQGFEKPKYGRKKGYIKFERKQPNDLWQVDIAGVQTIGHLGKQYLFALLDDCSRFIVAARYFPDEKGKNLILTLQEAFTTHGLPNQILADNGAQFRAIIKDADTKYTNLLKTLGVEPIFAKPYHPQTKGKLERWFGTVIQMFLVDERPKVKSDPTYTLQKLNQDLINWLQFYNFEKPHRSLEKCVPPEKVYFQDDIRIYRPLQTIINWDLWLNSTAKRKVTKYNIVKYCGKDYSVPEGFSGLRIDIIEKADSLDIYYKNTLLFTHKYEQKLLPHKERIHIRKITVAGTISWKGKYYTIGYKYKGKKVIVIPASSGKSIGIYYNDLLIEDILLEK